MSRTRWLMRLTSSTVVRLSGFTANSRCEHHLWRPYVTFVWLNMTCVTGLGCITTFDYTRMFRKWRRIDYNCETFRHVVTPRWRHFSENVVGLHIRLLWRNTTHNMLWKILIFGILTRVGTLIVATIYLQMIQNRYMFRSFTVLQCSHQHCVQPVASDVEVVGYL